MLSVNKDIVASKLMLSAAVNNLFTKFRYVKEINIELYLEATNNKICYCAKINWRVIGNSINLYIYIIPL